MLRCHVAAFFQRPPRALYVSSNCKTIRFRNVKQRTRLVQPQKSNMALGGKSLIGVIHFCSVVLWPPSLRDRCGLSAPQAMAKQYAFAMSYTDARLAQPQNANMALGGRRLIGVVHFCSDVLWPPPLRDRCGLSAVQATAKQYAFAMSNTQLGSSSRRSQTWLLVARV